MTNATPTRHRERDLFDSALPDGLQYVRDFITREEEDALLRDVATLDFREARYKAYTAKRRIASFGADYDFDMNVVTPGAAVPPFLLPLRERVGAWLSIPPETFAHALVTEYRTGTTLGWHRDAPGFGVVAGISLGADGRLRFRPYPPRENPRDGAFVLELEPRSAYALQRDARWRWQHGIAPTRALRYSITFRTLVPRRG